MQYPFSAFAFMFLIISSTIVYSGFSSPKNKELQNNEGVSTFDFVNSAVIVDNSFNEQIILSKFTYDPPLEEKLYPGFKHTIYGGKDYWIDENGFYHDKDGRVWKPMIVDTTAYTWLDDGRNSRTGAGDGKTSTNKNAKTTYGIAHANGCGVVTYGQTFHISGYGEFKVDDACGAARTQWRKYGTIRLDIRIPNRRYDGVWRSNHDIRKIAKQHGLRQNRLVLVLEKDA